MLSTMKQLLMGKLYLYDGDPESFPVEEYKDTSSEKDNTHPSFLYDKNNGPRIVEFYSPSCGHCIDFKPKYIKLAKEIIDLSSIDIPIHAISCSVHSKICKNQKVSGYPTVKLFKSGSNKGQKLNLRTTKLDAKELLGMLDIPLRLETNQQEARTNNKKLTSLKDNVSHPEEVIPSFVKKKKIFTNIERKLPTIPEKFVRNSVKREKYTSNFSSFIVIMSLLVFVPFLFSWFWFKKLKKSFSGRHKKTDKFLFSI